VRSACPEDNVEIFRPTDFLSFAGPKGYNLGGLGGLPSGGLRGMMACARLLFNCEHPRIVIEYGPVIGKLKTREEKKRRAWQSRYGNCSLIFFLLLPLFNLSHICHILSYFVIFCQFLYFYFFLIKFSCFCKTPTHKQSHFYFFFNI